MVKTQYNPKNTNLTEQQWHTVRTPQFKAWFGDWENDAENASKVVDENGEPLVVYHGSKSYEPFNEFWCEEHGNKIPVYFAGNRKVAESYGRNNKMVFPVFLNITDARIIHCNAINYTQIDELFEYVVIFQYKKHSSWHKNYFENKELAERFLNKIENKLSSFYIEKEPDIESLYLPTFSEKIGGFYDGVIYKNIYDLGYGMKQKDKKPCDIFTLQEPCNIKSALKNNGSFDKNNLNIYK